MRFVLLSFFLSVATPLFAEEPEKSLMQQGLELFFDGLSQELEPAIQDLSEFTKEIGPEVHAMLLQLGPELRDLIAGIEDWSAYEAPEVLPNGDIIIRKRPEDNEMDESDAPQVDL